MIIFVHESLAVFAWPIGNWLSFAHSYRLTIASLAHFASLANALRMPRYSVYSVDEHGSISGQRTLDAVGDDEAIFAVRSMQRPLETQIWDGDRRIARIPPHGRDDGD